MTRLGFGGHSILNSKFYYTKNQYLDFTMRMAGYIGVFHAAGAIRIRIRIRPLDHFRTVTHVLQNCHTCSSASQTGSARQLDQFRTVTHMFRAAIHMKFKFQIWRAQRDLDAHLLREKDSLNVSAGWLKYVNQHDNCSNNIRYYPIHI